MEVSRYVNVLLNKVCMPGKDHICSIVIPGMDHIKYICIK